MLSTARDRAERDRARLETALRAAVPELGDRVVVGVLGRWDSFERREFADGESVEPDQPIPVSMALDGVFVGPVVAGSDGPCSRCLALRWQKRRSAELRTVLEAGSEMDGIGANPSLTAFLVDTVAALCEHVTTVNGNQRPGIAEIYGVAPDSLRTETHELLTDPCCPRCRPRNPCSGVIPLSSRPKPAVDADRLGSARDVLDYRASLLNPVCGMLGKAVTTECAHTTTVPAAGQFQVRDDRGIRPVPWSGYAESEVESAALAVCEAMERYAGVGCGEPEIAVLDSYANLTDRAVDPVRFGLSSDMSEGDGNALVSPYRPDLPIRWVWGHCLTTDRRVLVPQQLVYYGSDGAEAVFVAETSNGGASGSCAEEAILHGIFELIERDAFLLAWYGGASLPEINPDTSRSAATRYLLERVRARGYDVRAFDARIDMDIPVVVVAVHNRDSEQLGALAVSASAHFDSERALASALREVASCAANLREHTRLNLRKLRAMAADFSKVTELTDHAWLYGLPEMVEHAEFLLRPRPKQPIVEAFADWSAQRPRNQDLTDDVRFCVEHLAHRDFEVIAVDQTTPEGELLGMHTVRVLVPGMLPLDFGWSQQRALRMPRIFEAFRNAGWRDTPLDPAEVNRAPHPFM